MRASLRSSLAPVLRRPNLLGLGLVLSGGCIFGAADSGDLSSSSSSQVDVGAPCEAPADCRPDMDPDDGDAVCLDDVPGGLCTLDCETDDDCCPGGACGRAQTCVEHDGRSLCMVSCTSDDIAPQNDADVYCNGNANPATTCEQVSPEQRVCIPGECGLGAACDDDDECAQGLACIGEFEGGYCSVAGCESNDDCPDDSLCIVQGEGTMCAKRCELEVECWSCRPREVRATCGSAEEYVSTLSSAPVCKEFS